MKREIKFRGKRLLRQPGKWVYGNLILGQGASISEYDGAGAAVDPETVGQYTGLKDRNGNDIYEDDILDSAYFDARYEDGTVAKIPCVVTWDDDGWSCLTDDDSCLLSTAVTYGAVVIGNTHDKNNK